MKAKKFAAAAAVMMMTLAAACSGNSATAAGTSANGAAAAQTTGGQAASRNASGQPNSANFASGRVKAVNGDTIQVSTATEVLSVKTTGQTKIQRTSTGTLGDVTTGITVTVRGTRAADGSLAAQMIQIGNVMGLRPGGGGQGPAGAASGAQGQRGQNAAAQGGSSAGGAQPGGSGQGGAAAPGQAAGANGASGASGARQFNPDNFATGQVKQVNGNTIELTTTSSVVTVTLTDQTLIQKSVAASVTDIAVGERFIAQGTRGSNNTFTAQSIQIGDSQPGGQPGPGGPAPAATPAATN